MSDVKRYQIGGRDIPASAAVFLPSELVSSADYDALLAERDQLYAELRRVQAENQRLRGLQPEFPPRPPEGSGLPRYGLRWNGPQLPLSVPMDDGYWTPWHLAAQLHAELEAIRGQQPEVEAARLERFGAFMREVHGENGDGGASDGP